MKPQTGTAISIDRAWTQGLALRLGWLLPGAILLLVAIVYTPTLNDYFTGDDFPDLVEVANKDNGEYLWDILTFQGSSQFWRFLTRVVFLGEYRLFGLDARPYHVVNLGLHLINVLLVYHFAYSLTNRRAVGLLAALGFGLTPAHVVSVAWVTALNRILATTFFLLSVIFLHQYLSRDRRRRRLAIASFAAFLLAILSDEVAAFFVLILLSYAWLFYFHRSRDLRGLSILMASFVLVGAVSAISLYSLQLDNDYLKTESYGLGWHIFSHFWAYVGRLMYPIGAEGGTERFWLVHRILGAILVAGGLYFLARGPNLARFLALWVAFALIPYTLWTDWTPPRYTYLAAVSFAIGVSLLAVKAFDRIANIDLRWARIGAAVALAAAVIPAITQTADQNGAFAFGADRYRLLVTELQRVLPSVPPGSQIYIVRGSWTHEWDNVVWLPAIARTLYGNASLTNLATEDCQRLKEATTRAAATQVYVLRLQDGHLQSVSRDSLGCDGRSG